MLTNVCGVSSHPYKVRAQQPVWPRITFSPLPPLSRTLQIAANPPERLLHPTPTRPLDSPHIPPLPTMMSARLFRSTGIAPSLRTLITPSSSLTLTLSTQLRLRLAVNPSSVSTITTSACAHSPQAQVHSHQHDHSHAYAGEVASATHTHAHEHPYVRQEPTLSLTFTCTADECGHRSTHQFSKRSYTKGIVLIECPGCKNR